VGFSFVYPSPLPSTKGWGPGYPNCQRDLIVPHDVFAGGVRRELVELVDLLVAEMRGRGFNFMDPGCWGFACRGTKSSSGSQSTTPSFHSWGLALDINAPVNVFGADRANTQLGKPEYAWVVKLFREYGFFWLGPSIEDWMHFHFAGTKRDARRMTRKARENLSGSTSYRYKGRTFRSVTNLLRRLREGLKRAKPGESHEVRVRREGE
jgi:hypothetical protein